MLSERMVWGSRTGDIAAHGTAIQTPKEFLVLTVYPFSAHFTIDRVHSRHLTCVICRSKQPRELLPASPHIAVRAKLGMTSVVVSDIGSKVRWGIVAWFTLLRAPAEASET